MGLDYLAAEIKPQPKALSPALHPWYAGEPLKDDLPVLLRDAGAGIGDADLEAVLHLFRGDGDPASVRCVGHGILHKIVYHPAQLCPVAQDERQAGRELEVQRQAGVPGGGHGALHRFLQQAGQVYRLVDQGGEGPFLPGGAEQILQQ